MKFPENCPNGIESYTKPNQLSTFWCSNNPALPSSLRCHRQPLTIQTFQGQRDTPQPQLLTWSTSRCVSRISAVSKPPWMTLLGFEQVKGWVGRYAVFMPMSEAPFPYATSRPYLGVPRGVPQGLSRGMIRVLKEFLW